MTLGRSWSSIPGIASLCVVAMATSCMESEFVVHRFALSGSLPADFALPDVVELEGLQFVYPPGKRYLWSDGPEPARCEGFRLYDIERIRSSANTLLVPSLEFEVRLNRLPSPSLDLAYEYGVPAWLVHDPSEEERAELEARETELMRQAERLVPVLLNGSGVEAITPATYTVRFGRNEADPPGCNPESRQDTPT